ncbi:uncharacterized protein [Dermacentor albipictus]|uniref:uncharacterized protein n=1 Tax=Dermacentor albipictus TaxID=60249 RepID=UPI0031FC20D2
MARHRSTAVVSPRKRASTTRRAKPQQQQQQQVKKDEGPPIIPPDVVLWAAEQSDYIGFNPWFVTTVVGMINVAETLFGFTALVLLMFSPTLGLAHRTLLVTSFCMSYTSLVLLLGSLSAPFTDTYLPLSLYFFLFQLVAVAFYFISAFYTIWKSGDDTYGKLAAVAAALAGCSHYLHAKRCYIRVFNQPED